MTQAGWYPDPSGQGQRYWDGKAWLAPAPQKKRRRWPWVVLVVIAGLWVIGSLGQTNNGGSTSSTSSNAVTPTSAPTASIREEVRDGKFAFFVTSVDTSAVTGDTSNEFERVVAQGRFVNVHVNVGNTGSEPQTFSATNQKLSINGRQFAANSEAAMWTHSLNVDINPGNTISAVVSFDVPSNLATSDTQLELHDSAFSGGVAVNLPAPPGP